MLRKSNRAVPDWSRKILGFRQALKLTQGELGKRLRTSAMAVSRWERGDAEPPADVTRPTFCTTASERVYITTSSGKDANGGAQGAVGDRRAAICGANATGAGGLYPSAECGRLVLYSTRHFSITICASFSE